MNEKDTWLEVLAYTTMIAVAGWLFIEFVVGADRLIHLVASLA